MRTTFQSLDPDHLPIHADLATEYNRTKAVDFSTIPQTTHINAATYGLGTTGISDWQAIHDAIAAGTTLWPAGGAHQGQGVLIEIPAGTWSPVPPAAPTYGSVFPVVAPANTSNGGAIWIVGQGSGSTTITTPGAIGHAQNPTSSIRGTLALPGAASNGGAGFAANTFTLGFAQAHNAVVGQIIALRVVSRGRPVWAHYTIIAIPDTTHVSYMAGSIEDGSGNATSGQSLDLMIPPLTYIPDPLSATTAPNTVYFCEYLVEPLNFKQPHAIYFDRLTLQAGQTTGTPLDGLGIRASSRIHIEPDCAISGFWINAVYNATPHIHPSLPAAAQVPQNTDHNYIKSVNLNSGQYAQIAFIDNASSSYFRKSGQPGLGGGRDNHVTLANIGATGFAAIACNDAGNLETFDIAGSNMKGGSYPVKFEGVDGVDPAEPIGIDGIEGWVKIESPGNYSFAHDETRRRMFQKPVGFALRMEAGISINGADVGTPGGAGSVASGQFNDATDKPWDATGIKLTTVGGMPTLSASVPAAMFGVDGGLDVGTIVVLGNAYRASTMSAYTADGVTVAGAAGAGTFSSASIHSGSTGGTGGFTADDVGCRIDAVGLTGGSDTIKSITSTTTVVMDHAVLSSASGLAWTVKNDGTKGQSGVCHEGRVATVSAPSAGRVTITMPYPTYTPGTGLDLVGPYQGYAGELGHMRCDKLHSWDPTVMFDTQSLDRMTRSQQFFDVNTISPGGGGLTLVNDNVGPSTRRALPTFRIWDAVTRGAADGTTNSATTFTSASGRFTNRDVGKTLTATGLNAGAGTDTIASVQSATSVTMTHSANATASGLTWTLSSVKSADPFQFEIRRGQNKFYLYHHDGGDANAIGRGHLVKFTTSANNNLAVKCSVGTNTLLWAGVAMTGSAAGNLPAVVTNCDTGWQWNSTSVGNTAGRVYYNGAVIVVAQYPSVLGVGTDGNQMLSTPSTAVAAGVLLIDNGATTAGTVKAWDGSTTGLLVVGQSILSASSVATYGAAVSAVLAAGSRIT